MKNRPQGTATLELVLSMPILLAIVVGIVWLGTSVIAQTEVTIEARHKTWQQRNKADGQMLVFLKDDIVTEEATQSIDVSPIFDGASPAESRHNVMAGAWDHETLKMNNAPNWKLYSLAALNAKTASIQTNYVDAQNKLTEFKNLSRNLWQSLVTDSVGELTILGNSVESFLEQGRDAEDGQKAQERASINRKLSAKKRNLDAARTKLRNLDEDASNSLKDVLKNRVKRLEADVENLESDLEALDE